MPDDRTSAAQESTAVVGLVADPGLPFQLAQQISDELPGVLARRVSDRTDWALRTAREELSLDSHGRIPIVAMARERLPAEGWDLMVCLTDHPLRRGTRPVVADLGSTEGVALVSLPGVGWVRRQPHVRDAVVHLIGIMAAETLKLGTDRGNQRTDHHHIRSRPTERVSPVRQIPSPGQDIDVHLALTGARGQLRTLFGMVRDNRPWRLVPSLSRALAAAAATAAFGIFYSSIWRMADSLSPARLLLISAFAVGLMVTWLITYNDLWVRPRERPDRERTVLYKATTVLTLLLGVAAMYLLLFTVTLLAAIAAGYLRSQLGHPVGILDYTSLAWLASSMGTVAGALGSSLETEETVRRATYSKREQQRRAQLQERERQERDAGQPRR